jgi:glycosyltransferase involved in cell wall biosynthesis
MKLMVIHPLPSRKNARADQIARYLAKRGHEVHLVLWDVPYPASLFFKNFFKSFRYNNYNEEKVIIHKVRRLPFFFPFINKFCFKKQVSNIFNKNGLDCVISQTYFNETEPPLSLPLIYDFVDDHEAYAHFYGSKIYKLAFKILKVHKTVYSQIKKSKATIVVSDLLAEYSREEKKDNVYKILNGVDSWVLKERFKKKKYDFGNHSLVYVSGFDYWSQLPNLLYSVDKLRKEIPDIKLVLAGEGFQIPQGKKIVDELKLDEHVVFLGQVNDRKELFEIINSCDVCLNLSEKNKRQDAASPIKVFEYSALGKPVVSTRLKEVELLDFPNIVFYKECKNNRGLVKAIKNSFGKSVDKEKMKKMVGKYTWDKIIDDFENVIEEVVKK